MDLDNYNILDFIRCLGFILKSQFTEDWLCVHFQMKGTESKGPVGKN
jgi:hypothetical protein